ncbi:MAG: N-acetylmuramoyl-L-alanine amidase [Gammaproteobacteria bacterium]|nr:N-acetylmuramoyl-L-alanine amidase [Gammaproteobacteria bacterium]MDH5594201.1 N-acetylmuramoyl-L-alanine amidase [Gammaproteobacteria bacterium]
MKFFYTFLLTVLFAVAHVNAVEVNGARIWNAPDNTRLVFDVSGDVTHKVFTLSNPDRIVIDMNDADLKSSLDSVPLNESQITSIRSGTRKGNDLRIVLDMKQRVQPKSFVLKPNKNYGHRLVIDLYDVKQKSVKTTKTIEQVTKGKLRDIVIAIDAGHGGEDPGAQGYSGTREKHVVLAVARKLEKLIEKENGMRPYMVRTGDYYLKLRTRMKKAREQKADLFISLHADAFHDPRAKGSSVYVLSPGGASSEAARFLAESENSADLIGGVSLDSDDDVLNKVLLDLSQAGTIDASLDASKEVIKSLRGVGKVHKRTVQQAGFVVLKSPDIPSMLIELAFISNPQEEKKLKSSQHQQKMADAIFKGVKRYFNKHAPPGTLLAANKHVIEKGDTLSEIADKYHVSVKSLRVANNLKSNQLKVGKVLRIPLQGS